MHIHKHPIPFLHSYKELDSFSILVKSSLLHKYALGMRSVTNQNY